MKGSREPAAWSPQTRGTRWSGFRILLSCCDVPSYFSKNEDSEAEVREVLSLLHQHIVPGAICKGRQGESG